MSEMQSKTNTCLERIIAKIDNDFNPDNSDWIPRVAAWVIDALSQLNVSPTKKKRKKVIVKDRIAYLDCCINSQDITVYDSNGCKLKEANERRCCDNIPSTGEFASVTSDTNDNISLTQTISLGNTPTKYEQVIAETVNDKYPYRYNVHVYKSTGDEDNNYVIVDNDKIELNFDTNYIYVETEYIETYCSEVYGCELPVIPNNGILIEAITYYCMYKMLTRGYKHPVFNLQASQYGTNPYYEWKQLKDSAKSSVLNDIVDKAINKDSDGLWRSNFFINTFDPER